MEQYAPIQKTKIKIFTAVQAVLWIGINAADIYESMEKNKEAFLRIDRLRYLSILLCFAYVLFLTEAGVVKYLCAAALLFALCADFFLIFMKNNAAGILFFQFVQITYLYRFFIYNKRKNKCSKIKKQNILCSIAVVSFTVFEIFFPVLLLAGYAMLTVINNCFALRYLIHGKESRMHLFCAGVLLLLSCDVCVLLYNVDQNACIMRELFERIGIWFFYIPSQTCIALSAYKNREDMK